MSLPKCKSSFCSRCTLERKVWRLIPSDMPTLQQIFISLQDLNPDVIITQDLCNVCSVDLALVRKVCTEMASDPVIVSLNPFTLDDVLSDILTGRLTYDTKYCSQVKHSRVDPQTSPFSDGYCPFFPMQLSTFMSYSDSHCPVYTGKHRICQECVSQA